MNYRKLLLLAVPLTIGYSLYTTHDYPLRRTSASVLPTVQSVVQETPDIQAVHERVNIERRNVNIGSLALDERLNQSAAIKCQDHTTYDYWAHDNPNGTVWSTFIDDSTDYTVAGENLAKGYKKADRVVYGWMNSPLHKENIVNAQFTRVGYAYCKGTAVNHDIVVQHFTD